MSKSAKILSVADYGTVRVTVSASADDVVTVSVLDTKTGDMIDAPALKLLDVYRGHLVALGTPPAGLPRGWTVPDYGTPARPRPDAELEYQAGRTSLADAARQLDGPATFRVSWTSYSGEARHTDFAELSAAHDYAAKMVRRYMIGEPSVRRLDRPDVRV